MTETRTTSSTGGQKGVKPERHSLIPRKATAWISRVFGFGATKYEDHNWRRGYEWDKSIDALQRHIDDFVDGFTYDEESGLPHLAHAGFHIMVLLTWLEEQGEGVDNPFDTRWPHAMERARRAKERAEQEAEEDVVVAWGDPAPVTLHARNVSLETIALATGQPVEELRDRAGYSFPLRFIAGIDPARLGNVAHFSIELDGSIKQRVPGFHVSADGETSEDFGARWIDEEALLADAAAVESPQSVRHWVPDYDADRAADLVTGHAEALDRAFNPPTHLKD